MTITEYNSPHMSNVTDIQYNGGVISYDIPLTGFLKTGKRSNKIRTKRRENEFEIGIQTKVKDVPYDENTYFEWQIGYDAIVKDAEKIQRTTLPHLTFIANNGKEKALYECSEVLKYMCDNSSEYCAKVNELSEYVNSIEDFIDESEYVQTEFISCNEIPNEDYVCIVHAEKTLRVNLKYDWAIEIKIKPREKAAGVQAMLYVCIPVKDVSSDLIGRCANVKEIVSMVIDESRAENFITIMKYLARLSRGHKKDVQSILKLVRTVV